ncbi:MAG: HlyD family type I secretion periplasmic adaptor subunit [Ketobacteraceae bacterium]|nr:HlyD family type I secretion periplasmic adaptor subunit [Ketobacteraceae bacterium]
MSALAVLRDAWNNRETLGDKNKSRELTAFLPAALEIQEKPPHPIAKWVGRTLIGLFTLGLIWACIGKVNVVASAEGKIIPSSRVKQIQTLETVIVKKILVKEGQKVEQGQPLIELDSVVTKADQNRIVLEITNLEQRAAVNNGLLALLELPESEQNALSFDQLKLGSDHSGALNNQVYKQLLWQTWQDYTSQIKAHESTLAKTLAEVEVTKAVIGKLEQILPITEKRVAKLKQLYQQEYVSESEYLDVEQQRIQQAQDLKAETHRIKQLQAAQGEITEQIKVLRAQTKSKALTELTESNRQLAALKEELNKANDLNNRRILYAPVAGEVQQLTANTVGGVVTEANPIMLIVPKEEQLQVEVFLENKDIGFVQEGMPAEIKVHTFPFTKYGVIDAKVLSISNDAIMDEQRGLIYSMQLAMEESTILVNGRDVQLMPGMAVTAEMQTGDRKIIEFFLAPLLKYGAEGLRER